MKCFSLFSGIGGFDLALEKVGIEVVGACEIDQHARQIYSQHFPGIHIHEDATKLKPKELPNFDFLCAGFPCQPFSSAGHELGFEDIRGTLFYEICRIAKEKRPKIIFIENVRGLLWNNKGETFYKILETLGDMGYNVQWQICDSKYFVSQERERIFLIASLGKMKPIFPIHEGGYFNFVGEPVLCYFKSHTKGNIKQREQLRHYTWTLDTNATKVMIGEQRRKLTPEEYEKLQGFPVGWTKGISNTQRIRCLGNAVTPPLVEYILRRLIGSLHKM